MIKLEFRQTYDNILTTGLLNNTLVGSKSGCSPSLTPTTITESILFLSFAFCYPSYVDDEHVCAHYIIDLDIAT